MHDRVNSQGFGQVLAERLLKNAWENKRLASCYLFLGSDGTGRRTLARSLSKTVNCEVQTFPPCLVCSSCRKIENNNHPDVHYLEKQNSGFIKIEQIHQMQREISLRSFEARYKVFIIFAAEDMTSEASNCLLKTLEEPPGDCLIILIASDLRRIFSTVISRCQKVRFESLERHEAEVMLNCDYHLDKKLSHYLAFEGRLNEALKFKQEDVLNEKNQIIRHFITGSFQTKAQDDRYDSLDKEKLSGILKTLISCIRDIYLLKIGIDKSELIHQDVSEELLGFTQRFSFADLDWMFEQLCNWLENVKQNINPRLLFDNLELLWKR